jgi:mannose-6-phosphate isomerase-like protein (cupin superfamily)
MRYVFSPKQAKRYRFPTHINDLVMDRSEASCSEVFIVVLSPGEAPPLHQHDDFEQVFYVLDGHGTLEIGPGGEEYPVNPGDVVRIPPSTLHRIHCLGNAPLKYLAVDCFLDGRPDAEPTWDDHIKTACQQLGWDYYQIVESE